MRGYSIGDILKNLINFVYTKIFWRPARLVRMPIMARHRKNIFISEGFTCGSDCRLNPGEKGRIKFGRNFTMGDQCQIEAMDEVIIGDDVLMASRIYIGDASHGVYSGSEQTSPDMPPNSRKITTKSINIGNRVWIGNGVSVLPGIHIGEGAIIGAGSIVTHDIPPKTIAVGNPIRLKKEWDGDKWARLT